MLEDFGVVSTCKNRTLGRKSAPESVNKLPGVQLTPGRPPHVAEIYPVEERVSPEGSVFTSPSGVCMHRSARPYLHLLSSLDENIFFLFSWLFDAIRIEHRFLCDVRGCVEGALGMTTPSARRRSMLSVGCVADHDPWE